MFRDQGSEFLHTISNAFKFYQSCALCLLQELGIAPKKPENWPEDRLERLYSERPLSHLAQT